MRKLIFLAAIAALAAPLGAKDSLGVYSSWAAFRDAETPRCYAIAKPRGRNTNSAFASIGTWPKRSIRNQVHFRLSRETREGSVLRVRIDTTNFDLVAQGLNAWAPDARTDAAIVAALRSASAMRVNGGGVSDRYDLSGVATAMDAAIVGCADL